MILDLGKVALLGTLSGNNWLPTHLIMGTSTAIVTGTTVNTFSNAALISPVPTSSWSVNLTDPATQLITAISITATLNVPLNNWAGSTLNCTEIMLVHATGTFTQPTPITYSFIQSAGIATTPAQIATSAFSLFSYSALTGSYTIISSTSTLTFLWVFSLLI